MQFETHMFILFNNAGRLRSGWRLLIFSVFFAVILFLFTNIIRGVYALLFNFAPALLPRPIVEDLVFRLLTAAAAIIAGYICTRWLEGLPWRAFGLSFRSPWLRDLFLGSLIGIAALTLAAAIAKFGGGLTFAFSGLAAATGVLKTLLASAVVFVFAALAEEALFRGYPLQTLTRAHLVWLAIVLTSLFFALAHFSNPHSKLLSLINTALAGIWFVVAYMRTRTLWLPLGLHWSWNWALASVYGLPVSGMTHLAPYPLFRGTDLGPAWLTGGDYGIEGGVACTVSIAVFTIFTWRTRLFSASPEMKQMTSDEHPATPKRNAMVAGEAGA